MAEIVLAVVYVPLAAYSSFTASKIRINNGVDNGCCLNGWMKCCTLRILNPGIVCRDA